MGKMMQWTVFVGLVGCLSGGVSHYDAMGYKRERALKEIAAPFINTEFALKAHEASVNDALIHHSPEGRKGRQEISFSCKIRAGHR